ncbi:glycosyltransferase family 4 protein [Patescibacteria group bacterium]|nr:glycosyltransferase family 4 protein [Patescibacteria group bacterium]
MKKVSVGVICADLNPDDLGGAEVHIVEVVRELAERGHKVHLFVGNEIRAKMLFESENVEVHSVKYKKRKNLNSLAFIRAAVKQIPRYGEKLDLLHAKQVYPQAVVGAKLKRKMGLPLYVTVQNPLAYKEELVLKGVMKLLTPFLWVLGGACKRALRAADICGCVSEYSEKNAVKMGAKKTVRVPNGIDLSRFEFYSGKRNRFEIVTTSTLIPRNGIDTLVEAMPGVLGEYPSAKLKIAGEGPMEAQLRARVKQLKIAKNVDFLGTLRHSEIPELVREAHVYCRPSRFEGFGVSFIEAMALGTPVVTCPVGGIVDFVTDGETGMLVPPDDAKDLSRAIRFVFEHEEATMAIVKKARDLVEERYEWKRIAGLVENAYEKILSKGV